MPSAERSSSRVPGPAKPSLPAKQPAEPLAAQAVKSVTKPAAAKGGSAKTMPAKTGLAKAAIQAAPAKIAPGKAPSVGASAAKPATKTKSASTLAPMASPAAARATKPAAAVPRPAPLPQKVPVTQPKVPTKAAEKTAGKAAAPKGSVPASKVIATAPKDAPPPVRKAMTNAAATQALLAASKASAAAKAAEPPPPPPPPPPAPVQTITPPIPMRPGMSRPGMPGMRPAFSITPRLPMGSLRSGGLVDSQSGVSGPKVPPPKVDFRAGDMVVYPTHGVGTVQGLEDVNVAGIALQVITVTFEENRMTLRVPTNKAASAGLRKLAGPALVKQALDTLKGRARIKRTMWSRRAQEYEAKINSGDPVAIAEVVRDLFRNAGQPDQSFSERQIYEQALDRLAMEFAALEKTDKPTAIERLIAHMRSAERPGKPIEEPIEED